MNETSEDMIEFFKQNREIEFIYKDKLYAFLTSPDGYMLVCENKIQGSILETYDQMVYESKIDGKTFLEHFENDDIKIEAIL